MQRHKIWIYKNSNNLCLQKNSMRRFYKSHIMQKLSYILTDILNTSHCIFMISKKNMTWCWNINNWKNTIHELTELMKLWSLIYNTVKAIIYMIYHNMFMITITQTQHNMNCSHQAAWCCLKTTSNFKKLCCFRTTKTSENSS